MIFKVKQSEEYYKKKFQNNKTAARKRQQIIRKQRETGGGSLTKEEQRIIKGPEYSDLILKLGISASGSAPRADSDAQTGTSCEPPTKSTNCLFFVHSGFSSICKHIV